MALLWIILLFIKTQLVLALHLVVYKEELNWFVAQFKCAGRGGSLVSPNSSYIRQNIMTVANFSEDYWIGVSLDTNGYVFDYDNFPVRIGNYSNDQWHSGEPNHKCVDQCIRMLFTQQNETVASWRTTFCKLKYPYICQFDEAPTTIQTTEMTTNSVTTTLRPCKPVKRRRAPSQPVAATNAALSTAVFSWSSRLSVVLVLFL